MSTTNNNPRFARNIRTSLSRNTENETESFSDNIDDTPSSSNFKPSEENINSNVERFQKLKNKQDTLKTIRTKREVELEQTEKTLNRCIEEANKYGVNSLAELRELIKNKQEEEKESLNIYEEGLLEEERILSDITENLKNVE